MQKQKQLSKFGPLLVALAAILWSIDGILRRSLYTLSPLVLVTIEHIFGLVVLLFFASHWLPELKKMTRKTWSVMAVVALLSSLLGTFFYTAALGQIQYIQYSVVVLLQQTQPLFAITAAALFLKEPIRKSFLFWVVLALVGAFLITFKDLSVNLTSQTATMTAGLLALGAAFCWGSTTALSKYVLNQTTPLTAAFMRFLLTSIFGVIGLLVTGAVSSVGSVTSEQLGMIAIITLSTGMVALAIYYYGLKRVPARVSTLYELTWPASALLTDIFVFNATFSLTQVLGLAILATTLYKVREIQQ